MKPEPTKPGVFPAGSRYSLMISAFDWHWQGVVLLQFDEFFLL